MLDRGETSDDLALLRRGGERLTRQRRAVWHVFGAHQGHLTVDAILAELRRELPRINSGTVYRELAWLKNHGLISETDVGCGAKVYERVTEPLHHHLVCLECGRVGDLEDRFFDGLRRMLQDELGFAPRIEHFAVYGTCAHCLSGHAGSAPGPCADTGARSDRGGR